MCKERCPRSDILLSIDTFYVIYSVSIEGKSQLIYAQNVQMLIFDYVNQLTIKVRWPVSLIRADIHSSEPLDRVRELNARMSIFQHLVPGEGCAS